MASYASIITIVFHNSSLELLTTKVFPKFVSKRWNINRKLVNAIRCNILDVTCPSYSKFIHEIVVESITETETVDELVHNQIDIPFMHKRIIKSDFEQSSVEPDSGNQRPK